MKKALLCCGCVLVGSHIISAAPSFSDGFDSYLDGNLAGTTQNGVGQGPWAQTSTSTATPIQVSNGKVLLGTSGQDAYAPMSSSVSSVDGTSFYVGMTLNLSAAQAAGDYFLHFTPTAGETTLFFSRLFARSSGAGFQLGYLETSGTGSGVTYGTGVLNLNTDYRVLVAYHFVAGALNDTASIYVDPTDPSAEANNTAYHTDAWTSANPEPTTIAALNFRQGTAANAASVSVDNLVAGTVFSEVVPVPEPTGLFALGSLGLLAWTVLRRRR